MHFFWIDNGALRANHVIAKRLANGPGEYLACIGKELGWTGTSLGAKGVAQLGPDQRVPIVETKHSLTSCFRQSSPKSKLPGGCVRA
jgi:hypothetical protein